MLRLHIEDMDLAQIAKSGQCFRMNELKGTPDEGGPFQYEIIATNKILRVGKDNCSNEFVFDCEKKEFDDYWRHYFDLETDYGKIKALADPNDSFMCNAIIFGSGIRILNQDIWEMIVTFLISQQNNIPRIRKCVENICQKYGEVITTTTTTKYAFPTPRALAFLDEDALMDCNLGYRSKYVVRAAREVENGTLDTYALMEMDYEAARKRLLEVYGIGKKVADCICLFALHHVDAFPIDTHIKQILDREYSGEFPFERYSGFAGIIQQYIFYYELNHNLDKK